MAGSVWNDMYLNDCSENQYDFISDYECIFNHPVSFESSKYCYRELWDNLQAAKQQGTRISIVNIAHFTKPLFVDEILDSIGFKAGMKKINEDAQGREVKAKLSWWSPIFGQDDIKRVRDTLGEAIQPFLAELSDRFHGECTDQDGENDGDQGTEKGGDQDIEEGSDQNNGIAQEMSCEQNDKKDDDYPVNDQDDLTQLLKQFASSNAFNPKAHVFGSVYFQYDINDLCDFYRNCFDDEQELQFKILGTFSYKKEVMHAVLICSQEYGNGLFKKYPPVSEEDNEAVITRDNNGNWVWKPQATGIDEIKRLPGKSRYPMYRRWEQVAFAFHIPKKWGTDAFIPVPDLRRNLSPDN